MTTTQLLIVVAAIYISPALEMPTRVVLSSVLLITAALIGLSSI